MEKIYKISRIILVILTIVIFSIMFIHEDSSWSFITIVLALITYGLSFPSSIISKKIIEKGNKIENKVMKVLYYAVYLPIIVIILTTLTTFAILYIITAIDSGRPEPTSIGEALSPVVLIYVLAFIGDIAILTPYIQTIIVLILKKKLKTKEKDND